MWIKIQNNDIDKFAWWTYTWDVVNQQWSVARASVQHLVPEKVYLWSNLVYNAMDVSWRPVPNYWAWIYHNVSDWIISLSADGSTWYTISDKNLWATTVYNNWDIISEANGGKYYQWWNNYWFDWKNKTSSTRVDASSYWPNKYTWYYSDDTFITWSSDWSSVQNDDLWWDVTNTNAARQWPAPEGFHVPSITEWEWLITIMDWLSLTTWDGWRINLHMPFAGYRNNSTAARSNQGSKSYYWSSSPTYDGSNRARYLLLNSSRVNAGNGFYRAYGLSVRCFKNSFELPTSSWTVINGTLWSAWIFWDTVNWLISITGDGTTWYTIQDKNLWATTVYSDWDALTQDNMGNMYQWWNNYWFPSTWTLTDTSSTQVDASWYWPVEFTGYYDSDTFIYWNNDWSSVRNDNLWWNTDNTNAARKWPCARWYHVPSMYEWQWVKAIMNWLSLSTWDDWRINLHMPFEGYCYWSDASFSNQGVTGYYCSSTPDGSTSCRTCQFNSWSVYESSTLWRAYGFAIRPFKNEFVTPTSSWTVIQWTLWSAWIFWDQTNGLISITSDWTTGYTMTDKNLWATTVYSDWDKLSLTNCWLFYQWWNNHWFLWILEVSDTKVDASTYWPWNYYSSSIFITASASPYDWSSQRNDNLWWDSTWTSDARQWPCPSWYHVPSSSEWISVINAMVWLSLTVWSDFRDKLHLPFASYRQAPSSIIPSYSNSAYYWTSSAMSGYAYFFSAYASSRPSADWGSQRACWYSIRPFKNTPVIPAQTSAWTIIYQPS